VVLAALPYWQELLAASGGVALSVGVAVLAALISRLFPGVGIQSWTEFWKAVEPYVILAAFSLAVGVLVTAAGEFDDWESALLAGFAWDKTLQVSTHVLARI
jgi:hypothetical protein